MAFSKETQAHLQAHYGSAWTLVRIENHGSGDQALLKRGDESGFVPCAQAPKWWARAKIGQPVFMSEQYMRNIPGREAVAR